jgi:hypothetical protein
MRCSAGTAIIRSIMAAVLLAAPVSVRADVISYFNGGNYNIVTQTLSGLGYDTSDRAIESTAQGFTVAGPSGSTTHLNFEFIRDLGGYQFSFGVFDRSAVSANPIADRRNWALQALGSATVVFDNREISIGATTTIEVAAGTELGLFLIPNDTLAAVLADPSDFFGGNRPDPLFSVSDANPGSFDQMLSFESGGLHTFAFEDLSRTGRSDQDFNDLIVTMTQTTLGDLRVQTETVAEPPGLALILLVAGALAGMRIRKRA